MGEKSLQRMILEGKESELRVMELKIKNLTERAEALKREIAEHKTDS